MTVVGGEVEGLADLQVQLGAALPDKRISIRQIPSTLMVGLPLLPPS